MKDGHDSTWTEKGAKPLQAARLSKARKRIFIGLLTSTAFLLVVFLVLLWIVPVVGLTRIHPIIPWILGILILGIALLIIGSALALVLNLLLKRPICFQNKLRGLASRLYLPLMVFVGRGLGISPEKVKLSFIQVNNDLVISQGIKALPRDILLLIPHCLQKSSCEHRLTYDIYHCQRCGQCPISGLITLSEKFGIKLAIATGGTIARRIVVQNRPRVILAVACERDLVSGIQDTYPLPVYGILNERPCGPCLDTLVDLEQIESALSLFLKKTG